MCIRTLAPKDGYAMSNTDTVTLRQAMADAGTADARLLGHAIARVAPGFPPFGDDETDPECGNAVKAADAEAWDAVKADVKRHVHWHADPAYTAHALPGGRERITRGPNLSDPVVYEG